MKSLLLDAVEWDLVKDASGNIAVASDPYALAQNASSAIRLFQGELWYDTTQGVPYFQSFLGKRPNVALIRAKFVAAALTVPGVASALVFISSINDRGVRGQVQVKDSSGATTAAPF